MSLQEVTTSLNTIQAAREAHIRGQIKRFVFDIQQRPINDTDAQWWGYADTHYYDPMGRETAVITALGYLRRARFYLWFTVAEDENDTLQEVMDDPHLSRSMPS